MASQEMFVTSESFAANLFWMNPYEPPESQISPPTGKQKPNLLLVWFLSVLGSGLTLPLWSLMPLGPIATCAACLIGGSKMAKGLHQETGVRGVMTLIYALLIAISLLGIFFGVCLVWLGSNLH